MREQEQRDAETKWGIWESKSSVMLIKTKQGTRELEQEQRDADTKQGTREQSKAHES